MSVATLYNVSFWKDKDELSFGEPYVNKDFETIEDAREFFDGINLEYEYKNMYRTCGWRSMRGISLVKHIAENHYDEDGEFIDSEYDPIEYEEFGAEDFSE